ncbi:MAG TPA: hypothetical protein VH500_05910 [Nitrososphaeraceae archaeon]
MTKCQATNYTRPVANSKNLNDLAESGLVTIMMQPVATSIQTSVKSDHITGANHNGDHSLSIVRPPLSIISFNRYDPPKEREEHYAIPIPTKS